MELTHSLANMVLTNVLETKKRFGGEKRGGEEGRERESIIDIHLLGLCYQKFQNQRKIFPHY